MNLNILWIDDDYKTQEDFISFAEQDGIDIHPFESHEEGMASLDAKPNFYHAAILDAKVKNKIEDTVTGLDGLRASRDRLIEMNKD
jgi:DNA-binding response OmpR family regulator